MATTTLASNITIPQGSFGPFIVNVPATVSQATVTIDRTNWTNPAVQLSFTVDLSLNNGASWASASPGPSTDPFPIVATSQGGPPAVNKSGQPVQGLTTVFAPVPGVGSTTRKVRISGTLTGGSLLTTINLVTN